MRVCMDTSMDCSVLGPCLPSVDQIAEACFERLEAEVEAGGAVGDAHLLQLHHLYGKNWVNALRLVDDCGVTCYVAQPSGRTAFRVKGKAAGDHYSVFPRHFCSCQAFFYEVVCKSDALCCKHQLAARLAVLTNNCSTVTVSDEAMAGMLMQSFGQDSAH
ncbi:hypothetical protein FOA52_002564 [Chlamydomonas sp. UWO 241]|nr:hypothetical protein FOA52_002564 [Chlamydomonas sp. UWO 241]